MTSITLDQFKTTVDPLKKEYAEKYAELDALRTKFENLVNKIEPLNAHPDNLGISEESDEYDAMEDLHLAEVSDIESEVADLTYDFDLEWSGSFNVNENSFWTPSTC